MPQVAYYRDRSDRRDWRYRIIANNNEIVHASHKGWHHIVDAYANLLLVRRQISDNIHDMNSGSDGWRWTINVSLSGTEILVSNSHEAFVTITGCTHNLNTIGSILSTSDLEEIVTDA